MGDTGRLLKKAARNLYRVLEDPEFWTSDFCRAFFEWCDVQAYETPDSALVRGQLALDLAAKTGDRHTLAKAHAVMASAYRRFSVPERCHAELETALRLAGSCPCCLSEVYRRLGGILIFQSRFREACEYLDQAAAHFRQLGDEDGVGRTLITRGVALLRLGRIDAALDDERRALQLLAPDTPQFFYIAALTNTAGFLATGERKHVAQAEPFLNELRTRLAGIRGLTIVRIYLSWTHGLVLAHLGERKRGLQMLRKARTRLLHRRQDAEVLAITSDISTLYCDTGRYPYIVDLVDDCLSLLGDVSGTRPLLQKVRLAAERELEETRRRLVDLREAVAVSVPTLTSRPSLTAVRAL